MTTITLITFNGLGSKPLLDMLKKSLRKSQKEICREIVNDRLKKILPQNYTTHFLQYNKNLGKLGDSEFPITWVPLGNYGNVSIYYDGNRYHTVKCIMTTALHEHSYDNMDECVKDLYSSSTEVKKLGSDIVAVLDSSK